MNVLKFIGGYMLAGTVVQLTVMSLATINGKREAKKELESTEKKGA